MLLSSSLALWCCCCRCRCCRSRWLLFVCFPVGAGGSLLLFRKCEFSSCRIKHRSDISPHSSPPSTINSACVLSRVPTTARGNLRYLRIYLGGELLFFQARQTAQSYGNRLRGRSGRSPCSKPRWQRAAEGRTARGAQGSRFSRYVGGGGVRVCARLLALGSCFFDPKCVLESNRVSLLCFYFVYSCGMYVEGDSAGPYAVLCRSIIQ